MFTFHPRLMACAALSAALLAGCGSSDGDVGANAGGGQPSEPVAQTITDVFAYINSLITDGGDSAEPLDTSLFTLVANDDAEPSTLP